MLGEETNRKEQSKSTCPQLHLGGYRGRCAFWLREFTSKLGRTCLMDYTKKKVSFFQNKLNIFLRSSLIHDFWKVK